MSKLWCTEWSSHPEHWSHSFIGSVLLTIPETNYNFSSFLSYNISVSAFWQITVLLIPGLSPDLFCITITILILTFKTPHDPSQAEQTVSSTFLSFPWSPSTETSCLFYQEQEYWPYSLSHTASTFLFPKLPLPEKLFSLHRCISRKFLQKYLYDIGVYHFIKETVRRIERISGLLVRAGLVLPRTIPTPSITAPSGICPNLGSLKLKKYWWISLANRTLHAWDPAQQTLGTGTSIPIKYHVFRRGWQHSN